MLKEIKEQLIEKPDSIVELLEEFDFEHISLRSTEIRFARNQQGGPNISIRLENNDYLNVNDYARGVRSDIFSYIIEEKGVTFRDVIQATKRILGLDNNWAPPKRRALFGGIYQHIINPNANMALKVYDENILDQYDRCGNQRFLRDGISLESQKFWNIRFSINDDAIIIPLYNEYSELVGVKSRINHDPENDESKYFYTVPVAMSQLLYGYSENYSHLYGADVIYVGESEKFCQQLYTIGVRNCVSLGSHTLSEKHAKLLMQLNAKSICFMFDEGLNLNETLRNAEVLRKCASMREVDIKFFDYRDCLLLNKKDSPSDRGLAVWNDIIENNIKDIKELEIELQHEKEVDY